MISIIISDTIDFRHHHITQPSVTPEDRVLHGLQHFTAALQGAPSSWSGDQIRYLQFLKDTLDDWSVYTTPKDLTNPQQNEKDKWDDRLSTRVQPPVPRVKKPTNRESPQAPRLLVPQPAMPAHPVAHRTHAWHMRAPPAAPPKVPPMAPTDVL